MCTKQTITSIEIMLNFLRKLNVPEDMESEINGLLKKFDLDLMDSIELICEETGEELEL